MSVVASHLSIHSISLFIHHEVVGKIFCHLNWIKLATNPVDSMAQWIYRAAVQKLEEASSNRARDNKFFVGLCSQFTGLSEPFQESGCGEKVGGCLEI